MTDGIEDWSAARLAAAAPGELGGSLERGAIVRFRSSPVELPAEPDQDYLRTVLPALLVKKNVSYHPEAGRTVGVSGTAAETARTDRLLREHLERVEAFLARAIPELVPGWTVGTSSLRPLEERGRNLSPHASNELVHVDAGAYGATCGDRILRFFVNLNPEVDRVWATRGTFAELYRRWGARAGLVPAPALGRGPLDRLRSGALRAASSCGLPLARALDSSPYDRAMRRFHNFMKDDPEFRAGRDGYEEMRFGPFSAWMVLTDARSHACLSGRFALVSTFLVPLGNCRRRDLSPYAILESGGAAARSAAATGG